MAYYAGGAGSCRCQWVSRTLDLGVHTELRELQGLLLGALCSSLLGGTGRR